MFQALWFLIITISMIEEKLCGKQDKLKHEEKICVKEVNLRLYYLVSPEPLLLEEVSIS